MVLKVKAVNTIDGGLDEACVAESGTNGLRAVPELQPSGAGFEEEGREDEEVLAAHKRDLDIRTPAKQALEMARGRHAAKAAAQHDDTHRVVLPHFNERPSVISTSGVSSKHSDSQARCHISSGAGVVINMKSRISSPQLVLTGIVLIHLAVNLAHGFAHARANVALSRGAVWFVLLVILVGPILGLVVQRLAPPPLGEWIVAVTLAGALAFGVANHFLIQGADHVSHVAEPWRGLFGSTAVLLVATEALGSAVAVWCATAVRRAS
jgi:hypothetical protein